jgi:hypothetical protein
MGALSLSAELAPYGELRPRKAGLGAEVLERPDCRGRAAWYARLHARPRAGSNPNSPNLGIQVPTVPPAAVARQPECLMVSGLSPP